LEIRQKKPPNKMIKRCEFCNYQEFDSRLIFESTNFYFLFDLYPVIDFHFLIVTKKHHISFGHLSVDALKEAEEILRHLKNYSLFKDKAMLVFERGSQKENMTTNPSIDHAHLHLFILSSFDYHKFPNGHAVIDDTLLILPTLVEKKSYFFLWVLEAGEMLIGDSATVPSQFIRNFISSQTGQTQNWNWRENNELSVNQKIKNDLKNQLSGDPNFIEYAFRKDISN
jgi:diadenosine tetraphosphate (Ap4A) HIT family hydrolase